MSKIDQLRRQREEQHARQQEQTGTPKAPARAKAAEPAEPTPVAAPKPPSALASRKPKAGEDAEGTCSVCGKTRPLANGMVSNHQKGFGKMCAGSRKEPV
jgi:hypothetical protein